MVMTVMLPPAQYPKGDDQPPVLATRLPESSPRCLVSRPSGGGVDNALSYSPASSANGDFTYEGQPLGLSR